VAPEKSQRELPPREASEGNKESGKDRVNDRNNVKYFTGSHNYGDCPAGKWSNYQNKK